MKELVYILSDDKHTLIHQLEEITKRHSVDIKGKKYIFSDKRDRLKYGQYPYEILNFNLNEFNFYKLDELIKDNKLAFKVSYGKLGYLYVPEMMFDNKNFYNFRRLYYNE